MAIIKNEKNEVKINNGEKIKEACEQLGVPFGCRHGVCGVCKIEIVEGGENLSKMTEEELELGMDGIHRLACQCKINLGTVKIKF